MKRFGLSLIIFVFTVIATAQIPAGYYDTVNTANEDTLRATLHAIIKDHTRYPYTDSSTDVWDILESADEDPNNPLNVLDIYKNASYIKHTTGNDDYDREHSWPKSYGFPDDMSTNYPYTDCHHLFIANGGYNSSRSNKPFDTGAGTDDEKPTDLNNSAGGGTGVYPGNSNWTSGSFTSGHWETWIGRRGDVARALFYMMIRYEGGVHGGTAAPEPDLELTNDRALIERSNIGDNLDKGFMGILSVLIQWHKDDPVDDVERNRNDVVYSYQGNRNPFIDHPEYVGILFEKDYPTPADTTAPADPTGLIATDGDQAVTLNWDANIEGDLFGYNVYRSETSTGPYSKINGACILTNTYVDTFVDNGTNYYYVVTAKDTSANESGYSNEEWAFPAEVRTIMINEVDADTAGTDTLEFVELYDGGVGNTDLTGFVLVTFNGSDDLSYNEGLDLDGYFTDANGYFVIGNSAVANVDIVVPSDYFQNGADAVAIYEGNGTDFPNDTPITTSFLIDAMVYDTNDGDDAALLVLLNPGQPQVNEGERGDQTGHSNQRFPNGSGGLRNTDTYIQYAPTPGAVNGPTVFINEIDADTAGTDTLEFVELYDGGAGNTPLDGLVLVLYNGNGSISYGAYDLATYSTDANGYFIIGNTAVSGVDLVIPSDGLQNGADAVALALGVGTDYPNGTAVSTANLIDAVVYDTNDADEAGLLVLLNAGQPQLNEDIIGTKDTTSLQRFPNGSGGVRNTVTYLPFEPTPKAPNGPQLVINELDCDQADATEINEFIELYDGGIGNLNLSGFSVVLYNGSDNASYLAFDLDGYTTDADGYFVIGGTGVAEADLTVAATFWLQNGADAVALVFGDADEYPEDTPVSTDNLVDAVVYDTDDGDNAVLLTLLNPGQPQVNEGGNGDKDAHSIQRIPNGSGGQRNTDTFTAMEPTPGALNQAPTDIISDFVWQDNDGDGIQDAGELGISGITVNLYSLGVPAPKVAGRISNEAAELLIDTTTTDGNGLYQFVWVPSGTYFVEFVNPGGYTISPQDQGGDDTADSDADVVTGRTASFAFLAGTDQDTWDCGLVPSAPPTSVIINEVDADQDGTDAAEFVELYDGGAGNTSLDGLVLVFFNGSDDASYLAFDLDGYSTDENGYFVLSGNAANVPNTDWDVSPDTNLIQNGADAVALYTGNATDFPNDTPVTTTNLIDAIVYGTSDADDAGLLPLLNAGQPQVDENGKGDGINHSNQRYANGTGGARNTDTYLQAPPTPGEANSNGFIPATHMIINEVDADQDGTDSAEFIELYDGGTGNTDLSELCVVLYNGSNDTSYLAIDLDGYSTDENGYFVISANAATVPNTDLDVTPDTNLIQNGADAVALFHDDAINFPNGTAITTTNLLDALVYDTSDSDDAGLLALLNAGQPQVNENGAGNGTGHSNQRYPNGSGGQRNTDTYLQAPPTPGEANSNGVPVATNIMINEVDADQTGTDADEFIELYDGGVGNTALDGLVVVLYNGSTDLSYNSIDLDGYSTDVNGYFVIGSSTVPNVDLIVFTTNGIQNGADAVALYEGNATDFPTDTAITTTNLFSAVVYDTDDADDTELLVLLNAGQGQLNENANGSKDTHSNQRIPNGSGGMRDTDTFRALPPTPGTENVVPNYSISGHVLDSLAQGIAGVTIVFSVDSHIEVTDASGYYYYEVPIATTTTVTPLLAGYSFTPASDAVGPVTGPTVVDFTGTIHTYTISGTVTNGATPIQGATITFSHDGSTILTDVNGQYSTVVNYGTTTTVTPSHPHYASWTPASTTFNAISGNVTADFTGAIITFTITTTYEGNGTVTPLGNTLVDYGSNLSVTMTPANGWFVDTLTINGSDRDPAAIYTFSNITSNQTLHVGFTEDELPVIDSFTSDTTTGHVPLPVTFNVTAHDPDGGIIKNYLWDFDNDGTIDRTTLEGTIFHKYRFTGVYTATVTVVDEEGSTATSNPIFIEVTEPAPVILSLGELAAGKTYTGQTDNWIINMTGEAATITLTGKTLDGEDTETVELSLPAFGKMQASFDLFSNENTEVAEMASDKRVEVYSDLYNDEASMSSWFPRPNDNAQYLPHIAEETEYWDTFALISNPKNAPFDSIVDGQITPLGDSNLVLQDLEEALAEDTPTEASWGQYKPTNTHIFPYPPMLTGYEMFVREHSDGAAIELIHEGSHTIYIPHIPTESATFWTGFTFVNIQEIEAHADVTFYDASGNVCGEYTMTLAPQEKLKGTMDELFPEIYGIAEWGVITSDQKIIAAELYGTYYSGVCGFNLPYQPADTLCLPFAHTAQYDYTGISITNPHNEAVHAVIHLMGADGVEKDSVSITINAQTRYKDILVNLFEVTVMEDTDYIQITSSKEVLAVAVSGMMDWSKMKAIGGIE